LAKLGRRPTRNFRRGASWALLAALTLPLSPSSAALGSNPMEGELWVTTYDGPAHGWDHTEAVSVSPDGSRVYVTGWAGATQSDDYATRAYDASTGSVLWEQLFSGPGDGADQAHAMAVSPDGSKVFVTGQSYFAAYYNYFYATVAYDAASGAQLWTVRYDGPGTGVDHARAISVSPDGSQVFVTGGSKGETDRDYATVAYEATTGRQLWSRRYDGPGHGTDEANDIAVSPDGSEVVVTGWSKESSSRLDYATVAYDAATGARRWLRRYDGPANIGDRAFSVEISPDGSVVVVAGSSHGRGSAEDYATIAYDAATGAVRWVRRYNGPGNATDVPESLAIDPEGSAVFVSGYSDGTVVHNWATLAYDLITGAPLWARRSDGTGYAYSMAIAPDGSMVFVAGDARGGATTVAYAANTGSSIWARTYVGDDDFADHADALAVSGDGSRVFVTGYRVDTGSYDHDFLTLAYTA
jgi:WD40 repeat protein